MTDHPVLLPLLLLISIIATAVIWTKVLRGPGKLWFKLLCLIVSVIPFFGPVFYLFVDPPPTLPLSEQGKQIPKGTEIYPDFNPLIKIVQKILGLKKD